MKQIFSFGLTAALLLACLNTRSGRSGSEGRSFGRRYDVYIRDVGTYRKSGKEGCRNDR